jgi:hypothetical protein
MRAGRKSETPFTFFPARMPDARLTWFKIMKSDWFKERPENVQALYKAYPPWKFYTDAQTRQLICRVYGVGELIDGTLVLEVAMAHIGFTNLVVGGVMPEYIVAIPNYTDEQIRFLALTPDPESFLEPNGWMSFCP